MNVKKAYDQWAGQYDTNVNRTRDMEAKALTETLNNIDFINCLEIGCGTGKNTEWLLKKASHITAVDLSTEMLRKARKKFTSKKVEFHEADIQQPWTFAKIKYDLIVFSLVLEHIENVEPIFTKAAEHLTQGGYIYLGELHPFKQYSGSKARFETVDGLQIVNCFNHNISDFVNAAKKHQIDIIGFDEYFDTDGHHVLPRVLTLLFKKR